MVIKFDLSRAPIQDTMCALPLPLPCHIAHTPPPPPLILKLFFIERMNGEIDKW